jgi:hypothetical protein
VRIKIDTSRVGQLEILELHRLEIILGDSLRIYLREMRVNIALIPKVLPVLLEVQQKKIAQNDQVLQDKDKGSLSIQLFAVRL